MRRILLPMLAVSLLALVGCGSGIGVTLPETGDAEPGGSEPGDETDEPGDDTTEEPGDDTDEPGDDTDEPGDDTDLIDATGDDGPDDATGSTDEPGGDDAGPNDEDVEENPTVSVFLQEKTGLSNDFVYKGVWAGEEGRVIAVGNDGVIVERTPDGDWEIIEQGDGTDLLNGISGLSRDHIWAVGKGGVILQAGGQGFGEGGGCTTDADCEDGDPCTLNSCVGVTCQAEAQPGPGCCGSPVGTWGFDGGDLDGWTIVDSYGGITWNAHSYIDIFTAQPLYTSPEYALYFGDPAKVPPNFDTGEIVGGTVASPPVALPTTGAATLKFQIYIDTEASNTFDALVVQVEAAGGVVSEVWSKALVPQIPTQGFVSAEANLSAWAGQTVKVRFSFDSVDSLLNQGLGVFVDDVILDTTCDGGPIDTGFPTLWGVHSITEESAYAVGLEGTILKYDGASWKQDGGGASGATWYGLHGASGRIVLVGSGGAIQMSEGFGLVPIVSPVAADLRDVHSFDGSEFWVVGDQGTVIRGEASSFELVDVGTNQNLRGVVQLGPDDVWVVGDAGTLLHYDGLDWLSIPLPADVAFYDLHGIAETGGLLLLTGEDGVTLFTDLATGFTSLGPLTGSSALMGAWGVDGEGFLVGEDSTIFAFTGVSAQPQLVPTTQHLRAVWGAALDDVWAVGLAGVLLHFDGVTWTKVDAPVGVGFEAIWGTATDDIYVGGAGGVILHWDGTLWSLVASQTQANLRDVFGFEGGPVWAVGNTGTIMYQGPLGWAQDTIQPIVSGDGTEEPILDQLNAIWGAAPDDAWAVGDAGRVLHWDGTIWADFDAGTGITLRGIYGRAADDIFAVGSEGQILHYDGEAWSPMASGSVATLYDVHGDDADQVVIVGDIGTVLTLTEVEAPPGE